MPLESCTGGHGASKSSRDPMSTSIGVASDVGSAGTKIDSDDESGLMDGFLKFSSDNSGGTSFLEEPSLESMSAA